MKSAPPSSAPAPRLAQDLVRILPLSDAAQALLTPTLTLRQYLSSLSEKKLWTDAIRVLARGLPTGEAIWWGCVGVSTVLPKPWKPPIEAAITTAIQWVNEPTDSHRREAGSQAESAGWGTPAGCLAGAVWLSGGSLSPPSLPAVQPREDLAAQMTANALVLVSVLEPAKADSVQQQLLRTGEDIAQGRLPKGQWPK